MKKTTKLIKKKPAVLKAHEPRSAQTQKPVRKPWSDLAEKALLEVLSEGVLVARKVRQTIQTLRALR